MRATLRDRVAGGAGDPPPADRLRAALYLRARPLALIGASEMRSRSFLERGVGEPFCHGGELNSSAEALNGQRPARQTVKSVPGHLQTSMRIEVSS